MKKKPARGAGRKKRASKLKPSSPRDRPTKSDVAMDREEDVSRAQERSLDSPLPGGKAEIVPESDADEDY